MGVRRDDGNVPFGKNFREMSYIGVLESNRGLNCGCSAYAGRPDFRRAFGNNYGSPFCQEMLFVLGATDLGLARSVLPPSSMTTITQKISSFILPSARFSIGGTTLLFSQNTGTDLSEPRSVAPRSQSVITFENSYCIHSGRNLFPVKQRCIPLSSKWRSICPSYRWKQEGDLGVFFQNFQEVRLHFPCGSSDLSSAGTEGPSFEGVELPCSACFAVPSPVFGGWRSSALTLLSKSSKDFSPVVTFLISKKFHFPLIGHVKDRVIVLHFASYLDHPMKSYTCRRIAFSVRSGSMSSRH